MVDAAEVAAFCLLYLYHVCMYQHAAALAPYHTHGLATSLRRFIDASLAHIRSSQYSAVHHAAPLYSPLLMHAGWLRTAPRSTCASLCAPAAPSPPPCQSSPRGPLPLPPAPRPPHPPDPHIHAHLETVLAPRPPVLASISCHRRAVLLAVVVAAAAAASCTGARAVSHNPPLGDWR